MNSKTKRDSKGNVERYKARLVAKVILKRKGLTIKRIFSSFVEGLL